MTQYLIKFSHPLMADINVHAEVIRIEQGCFILSGDRFEDVRAVARVSDVKIIVAVDALPDTNANLLVKIELLEKELAAERAKVALLQSYSDEQIISTQLAKNQALIDAMPHAVATEKSNPPAGNMSLGKPYIPTAEDSNDGTLPKN